ncbi:MAG: hypothetical protein R3D32_07435 [Nitratireductor sp.]
MERELYEREILQNRTRSLTMSDIRVTFLLVMAAAILMQLVA